MKKLSLLLLIVLTSSTYYIQPKIEIVDVPTKEVTLEIEVPTPELKVVKPTRDLTPLVNALMWVESRCDTSASYIYTLEDRWSKDKSIEMFNVIANYYHETSSYEKIARCWNGGPKGLQKKQTQKYWRKVQKRLKYNENSTDRESEV